MWGLCVNESNRARPGLVRLQPTHVWYKSFGFLWLNQAKAWYQLYFWRLWKMLNFNASDRIGYRHEIPAIFCLILAESNMQPPLWYQADILWSGPTLSVDCFLLNGHKCLCEKVKMSKIRDRKSQTIAGGTRETTKDCRSSNLHYCLNTLV